MMKTILLSFFSCLLAISSCSKKENQTSSGPITKLTVFCVNDQHGRIDNFAKIKYIVDQEEAQTNVIVACAGDMFSGNPIVDQYPEKGFPMIDLMNKTGFDISVLGNHEFDYGEEVLKARMEQAEFAWVCANVDMSATEIPQPPAFKTMNFGDLKVTFLGLVETSAQYKRPLPLTHPWRVQNVSFDLPENIVTQYADLKEQENADLCIALTHLGHDAFSPEILGDFDLAMAHPYFDLIIGGHTNRLLDTVVNTIPVFQAGNNLNYLGKIKLQIQGRKVIGHDYELIDLNAYGNVDETLKAAIEEYNSSMPELDEVIGFSEIHHNIPQVGCFYSDALRGQLNVDFTLQNSGGVRDELDQGDILKKEIFAISPFNNGTIVYEMTVGEIKLLLEESGSGFYYSGLNLEQVGQEIVVRDESGQVLDNAHTLTLGINDFIPAVNEDYFPATGTLQEETDAESIIRFLENHSETIHYPVCSQFFRYQ